VERQPQSVDGRAAQLGTERITQLEHKLELSTDKCTKLEKQVYIIMYICIQCFLTCK